MARCTDVAPIRNMHDAASFATILRERRRGFCVLSFPVLSGAAQLIRRMRLRILLELVAAEAPQKQPTPSGLRF